MLRDITLGQYYNTESPIHRLDPRTKLICTLLYLISLFVFSKPWVYLVAVFFLLFIVILSRIPVSYILRGMKAIFFLLAFTVILNLFFTKGEVLVTFWKISITREGVLQAFFMASRLILLIFGSNLMTLTTTPSLLTNALESVLGWLKIFKVPVHEIAMMMSIALRFIPILMDETDRIMKAQLARGADFESKSLLKKAKSLVPVLVPLFVSAFRRANDLALALEARCYNGGNGRTRMKPLKYGLNDLAAYIITALYFGAVVAVGVLS